MIRLYQLLLSPVLPPTCRFYPSCSHYSVAVLTSHGLFKGLLLSVWRVLRCNPFNPGGVDMPPPSELHIKEALLWHKKSSALQTISPEKI